MTRDEVLSYSILSPAPVCCYVPSAAAHVVYWRGLFMTRAHAMILVQENWIGAWPTPEMKEGALRELRRVYKLGAFGTYQHRDTIDSISGHDYMTCLRKWILKQDAHLITGLMEYNTIQDAMSWFLEENVIVITDE